MEQRLINHTELLMQCVELRKKELTEAEKLLNDQLYYKKVEMLFGKYKGRKGAILKYSAAPWGNVHTVQVGIFRLDNKNGFKGQEEFIDDKINHYIPLEYVKILDE